MRCRARTRASTSWTSFLLARAAAPTAVEAGADGAADKALKDVPRKKIQAQLREVGFDDERQAEPVSGLSGGWKMKLELARAMLYNADLLLLDEVSSFLLRSRGTMH
jgi:ATPase subunit of ABC transporter with duplicated ATPase domains